MKATRWIYFCVAALVFVSVCSLTANAYPRYSEGKVTNFDGEEEAYGYCKTCHGHFRATDESNRRAYLRDEYISPTDGKRWREVYTEVNETEPVEEVGLHDIHRHIMLDKLTSSRCDVCHQDRNTVGRYPVILDSSATTAFEPISCMGCHGRNEDNTSANPSSLAGRGAGLRQHHTNAGVTECKTCHADADPANYTPVGENVLPPYYFSPDPEFPNKPTDPCNAKGEEDYAGGPLGLDNDGDGWYDNSDRDCRPRGRTPRGQAMRRDGF